MFISRLILRHDNWLSGLHISCDMIAIHEIDVYIYADADIDEMLVKGQRDIELKK